jgi:hypothetical protein
MERHKLSKSAITSSTPADLIVYVASPAVNNINDIVDYVLPFTDETCMLKNAG